MITPNYLKKGDTIGIVSTARKVLPEQLTPALQIVEGWGLKTVLGNSIGAAKNQFAGSDALRKSDFQEMLDNPEIKAIWCAKGGYGTVRIIDDLDFSNFLKNPKWIIGYSDITVLHSHIHRLGVETLHAQTMLEMENKTPETADSIRKLLFGEKYEIEFSGKGYPANTTIRGQLVGGNLSILFSLCGSRSALRTDGKILFLEDLDEYAYHVDRMMLNLKRNGMLNNLAGFIVGGMTEMKDNVIPFGKSAEEIILDAVKEFDYPVCFNFPAGHMEDNRALILGREIILKVVGSRIIVNF